ncbi:MAG: hypothetical protein Q7S75_02195 [bacterium]|nr:hypothetical protein [bacterium]
MIKRILWAILALLIISFVVVWIWSGGIRKARDQARSFTNLVDFIFYHGTSTGATLRLPWQTEFPTGPTLPQTYGDSGPVQPQDQLSSLNQQYDALNTQITDAKTFGSPSPLAGQVRIINNGNATETTAGAEYLEIAAGTQNTAPVDLTGWSLQSAYTGVRAYIPSGASSFLAGTLNNVASVQLAPGQSAIVNSGLSPVGVSFRENICTGYLGQMQLFTPALSNTCPTPASVLPMTPDNLRNYGQTCFDFLPTIAPCQAPLNNFPPEVSQNCRAFVQDNLSYNGCVLKNRYSTLFARDVWRIYLNSNGELWQNGHDIIRLLDREGQTVDVLTY